MKRSKLSYSFLLLIALPVFLFCSEIEKYGAQRSQFASPSSAPKAQYTIVRVFDKLTFEQPVELISPDDGSNRIFVVEQNGVIKVLTGNDADRKASIFLTIENKVTSGGEMGLLGLAFHPNFKSNGFLYVNYTRKSPLETVIARYTVRPSNANKADATSEKILLTYRQPYSNHNGGKIAFGKDALLYIAAGDGGSSGDPENRAQNKLELLGKILRIDVNRASSTLPYGIPPDNPFANNTDGFRQEIFAYGLRNPWRFSFDNETGLLWAGDVGQNRTEEIDIIEKGGNYGWRLAEGDDCFKSRNCGLDTLAAPIFTYQQGSNTGRSVTGGYVCRDKNVPSLIGKYIYGDFVSGNVWALTHENKKATSNQLIGKISGGLSSFGQDSRQNLYLLCYGPGTIHKLVGE